MKKIRLILSAVLMMTAFGFIACSHSASGSNGSGNSSNTSSSGNYQVGDIVLNDGTYLRNVTSVSDADKAKAIAVIYKVTGSKAYDVGLVHNKSGLKWCLDTANGYNTNFTDLQCEESGSAGNLSFTGDTDGSDNFTKISQTLEANDDTEIEGNYPAFEFAKNYKNQTNSHVNGTAYANGWYLPAFSELFDIWKVKDTVDAKSNLCGGSQFSDNFYWSSSQNFDWGMPYIYSFIHMKWKNVEKDATLIRYKQTIKPICVCCIRAFN